MTRPEAVVFDIGNVLIEWQPERFYDRAIGPEARAMRDMGSKTGARALMAAAGVPIVPGASPKNIDDAKIAAREIGYPIMIKGSAGGGGKGMRLVHNEAELVTGWERASSEALKAFGDATVYLEKAIVNPRHVEIQVLGDRHGNVVHLFELDCSIQRRHQKVVEETPCPVATPELIEWMGEVAVKGAKAVGYFSAGTFEFLLGADGSFYFLEMNTRRCPKCRRHWSRSIPTAAPCAR